MLRPRRPKWPEITWSFSPKDDSVRILGINPWIYDFAAYNLWSRPVGLLSCLDALRKVGARIALLDCLDKTWEDVPWPRPHPYGKGHYPKVEVPRPLVYKDIPRRYSRYGLAYHLVRDALFKLNPPPDLVLVTSIMTYWYPGVITVLRLVKDIWPRIKVVLGGVYASLCFEHASALGFDLVLKGPFEAKENWLKLWQLLGVEAPEIPPDAGFSLALDLYPESEFSPLLGSRGCPFHCAYCASNLLYPRFRQKRFNLFWQEFEQEYQKGVKNFAFYDDALLVNPKTWLFPFLDNVIQKKYRLNLHTPNAMHVRYLTLEVCRKFFQAGLRTIRLGLETASFASRLDVKLTSEEWERGINNLLEAGFKKEQIGAYILFGLPEQSEQEVKQAISFVKSWGIKPDLAYFTPIPGTPIFKKACETSPYPLEQEPLFQNNSIWPCVKGGFSWDKAKQWKELLKV
ncbi:MAG: B12-binding domain-containing radical SAM protein [Desulfonauticus sp.]|nr:B12-binding domain-containing radical SAM protein [Desulfonauticus sp.]